MSSEILVNTLPNLSKTRIPDHLMISDRPELGFFDRHWKKILGLVVLKWILIMIGLSVFTIHGCGKGYLTQKYRCALLESTCKNNTVEMSLNVSFNSHRSKVINFVTESDQCTSNCCREYMIGITYICSVKKNVIIGVVLSIFFDSNQFCDVWIPSLVMVGLTSGCCLLYYLWVLFDDS